MTNSLISFSIKAYTLLLPFAWLGVAIVIIIFLPLSFFSRTREFAGKSIYMTSWLFGLTTWFLGATVTFATWGWIGLLVGLFLFGVGVVPIGIVAAFFYLDNMPLAFSLIVMLVITYACRVAGVALQKQDNSTL